MQQKVKPYAAMILLQLSYAVMYVVLLATLKNGMNQQVLLVYRNSIAAAFMTPFALWFERKERPKMTMIIFIKIIGLAVLQPVLDQNFYFLGAKRTSAGFASALENINPSIAFVMALLLRVEKMDIRQRHGQAKFIGAVVTIAGTIIMILYKGPAVEFLLTNGRRQQQQHSSTLMADKHESNDYSRINGILMLLVSCFSWTSFLLLQSNTLKSYPAKVSLTIYICCLGALMNTVIALLGGARSLQPWILGWDMRIFAVIYSGVVCSGLSYFILGMVMMQRGPVFASAFNPLTMIATAILSSIFLAEKTTLGTIIGATVIVIGLCSLLWGKSKGDPTPSKNEGEVEERELPVTAPSEQRSVEMIAIIEQKHHKEKNSFTICCDKYKTESRPSVH